MCRPDIRGRCLIFRATEPSHARYFRRKGEFRDEGGALNLPPREATQNQNFCTKLKSLSEPKITENLEQAHQRNGGVLLQNGPAVQSFLAEALR